MLIKFKQQSSSSIPVYQVRALACWLNFRFCWWNSYVVSLQILEFDWICWSKPHPCWNGSSWIRFVIRPTRLLRPEVPDELGLGGHRLEYLRVVVKANGFPTKTPLVPVATLREGGQHSSLQIKPKQMACFHVSWRKTKNHSLTWNVPLFWESYNPILIIMTSTRRSEEVIIQHFPMKPNFSRLNLNLLLVKIYPPVI